MSHIHDDNKPIPANHVGATIARLLELQDRRNQILRTALQLVRWQLYEQAAGEPLPNTWPRAADGTRLSLADIMDHALRTA